MAKHRSAAQGPAEYRVRTIWICNPLHYLWPIKGEMRIIRFEIRGPHQKRSRRT